MVQFSPWGSWFEQKESKLHGPHTFKFQLVVGETIIKDFHDILPWNTLTHPPHLWPHPPPEGHYVIITTISNSSRLKKDVVLLSYSLEIPWPESVLCQVGWNWPSGFCRRRQKRKNFTMTTTTTTTTKDNGHFFLRKTHLSFRLRCDKNCITLDIFFRCLYMLSKLFVPIIIFL